jgi:hypothetical protein
LSSEREKRLEEALAQFLKPIRGIPFELVVRSLCAVAVEKFDLNEAGNKQVLVDLTEAMRESCRAVQKKPIERQRPNEVGNDMEPFVIAALKARGMHASAPKTRAGKGKSTGYPDIRIETVGLPIYLEVKSYAAANHGTTQRSFYLSPADDPKVSNNGYHLLVGFEIERSGNIYKPVAFEIVDLFGLDCDMKAEFNSDNRRLYDTQRSLARERIEETGS